MTSKFRTISMFVSNIYVCLRFISYRHPTRFHMTGMKLFYSLKITLTEVAYSCKIYSPYKISGACN